MSRVKECTVNVRGRAELAAFLRRCHTHGEAIAADPLELDGWCRDAEAHFMCAGETEARVEIPARNSKYWAPLIFVISPEGIDIIEREL